MDPRRLLPQPVGFDWDAGNLEKSLFKHDVAFWEAEEVFFNRPLVITAGSSQPATERRYLALGRTDA